MIIPNGTLEFKSKTPGGIDPKTGYPKPSTDAGWSEPIPCQFIPESENLLAKTNGERITKKYFTVLLDEQPIPASEQVRLTDKNGKRLGEFSLTAPPEPLEAVDQIKILI